MIPTDGAKVFIKNKRLNKFLFVLRDDKPNIPNPNIWGLLGGGIEPRETPLEALRREIKEEVNIELYDIEFVDSRKMDLFLNGKTYMVTSNIFLAYTDAEVDEIDLYEGQRVGYFTFDELKKDKNASAKTIEFIEGYEKLF